MASVRPGTGRPVSLANERAFLAWARSALALLAGLAGLESVMAYRQWRANTIACRTPDHCRPACERVELLRGGLVDERLELAAIEGLLPIRPPRAT